jgi:hypothetical protein
VDTSKQLYAVTKVAEVIEIPNLNVIRLKEDNLMNITGMPFYEDYSPEELRYFDYDKGLKTKQTPVTVPNPGPDCSICLEPFEKVSLVKDCRKIIV